MSTSQIIAELPHLSRGERREVLAAILDLEDEADVLRDADRRAAEHFALLDALEAKDAATASR